MAAKRFAPQVSGWRLSSANAPRTTVVIGDGGVPLDGWANSESTGVAAPLSPTVSVVAIANCGNLSGGMVRDRARHRKYSTERSEHATGEQRSATNQL